MDCGGVPEGTQSLEEGGAARSHLQQTTSRGGLGLPSVLRHYMCSEEHTAEEIYGQREVWTGTPILKRGYIQDQFNRVERQLNDWDLFVPTEVVIDTPMLELNEICSRQTDSACFRCLRLIMNLMTRGILFLVYSVQCNLLLPRSLATHKITST